MNEEEFDGNSAASGLLKKVRSKRRFWVDVYKANKLPYMYRSPTEAELEIYVRKLARSYKKKKQVDN